MRNAPALGAALVLATVMVAASQTPVFRAGVELVAVDVTAVDDKGRPVHGLRPDDFTLTVDGQPRRLVSADFLAVSSLDQVVGTRAIIRPPQFASNMSGAVTAVRRVVLLVVDQDDIQSGMARQEIDQVGRFIDRFAPTDLVGLAAIPGGPSVDFTTDRAAVRNALRNVVGRWQPLLLMHNISLYEALGIDADDKEIVNLVVSRECSKLQMGEDPSSCQRAVYAEARQLAADARSRSRQAVTTLRDLVRSLSVFDGTKTIVFLSQAMCASEHRGGRLEFVRDARDVAEAAAKARVGLYVLRLSQWLNSPTERTASETPAEDDGIRNFGLETLTSMARGALFLISGTVESAMNRILLESSGYYLLGFEPQPKDYDGKRHVIDVKVGRPDVIIRSRREFAAVESVGGSKGASPEPSVAALLGAQGIQRDVPLRLSTYSLRDATGDRLRVIIGAEVGQGFAAPAQMVVGYIITDGRGKVAGNSVERLVLTPAGPTPGPLFYMGAAILPTGTYRLRFAAVDQDGRRGSVEHTIEARLTRGRDILLGDLMVLQRAERSWRPSVDGAIVGRDGLASLDIYAGNAALADRATVRLEVADDETAPPLATTEVAVAGTNVKGRLVAQGPIELGKVAPADYLLRAVVMVDGQEAARATRPIRVLPGGRR